jgi:hypothetical protein
LNRTDGMNDSPQEQSKLVVGHGEFLLQLNQALEKIAQEKAIMVNL